MKIIIFTLLCIVAVFLLFYRRKQKKRCNTLENPLKTSQEKKEAVVSKIINPLPVIFPKEEYISFGSPIYIPAKHTVESYRSQQKRAK